MFQFGQSPRPEGKKCARGVRERDVSRRAPCAPATDAPSRRARAALGSDEGGVSRTRRGGALETLRRAARGAYRSPTSELYFSWCVRASQFSASMSSSKRGARFFAEKGTLLITQRRFLSCNSSKGCPKGVPPLLVTGGAHVGRQDVGLCARNRGVPSRSVAGWSPAWRRTRATTLREKMVSKCRWNRFRDAVVPPQLRLGAPRV